MLKQRKKLLLVTAGFPFGEWERGFLTTEFGALCDTFDVTILSVGREDPLLYPVPEDIHVERFLYPKVRGKWSLLRHMLSPEVLKETLRAVKGAPVKTALSRFKLINAYYGRAMQVADTMERIVRQHGIDLIYTYWCMEPAVAACLLKKRMPDLRIVTRFHGHDLFQERRGSLWQPFRSLITEYEDRLVFACRMGQDYFEKIWGAQQKTRLCYLGCADGILMDHAPSDTLRIVSCSNLIPLKRVDCIVEALSLLPESVPVRWDHFGDGAEMDRLRTMSEKLLKNNISWQFHGRVPNHLLRDIYRELDPDLFLSTSSTEGGVPVSIQEAFSMGIPAIGTDVGGIPEVIIPGSTGLLLSAGTTARETADTLMEFYNFTPQRKASFSAAARQLWEDRFDARCNAGAFIEELQQVLS